MPYHARSTPAAATSAAAAMSRSTGRTHAQSLGTPPADSSGTVRVRAVHVGLPGDTMAVDGALVRAGGAARRTGGDGEAILVLPPGEHRISVGRIGFDPAAVTVVVRPRLDTTVVITLPEQSAEVESVVVTATRSGRRIEDEPLRVDVLPAAEVGAGFSLGGYTVLSLAGAHTDLSAYRAFCASPDRDFTCGPQPEFPDAPEAFARLATSDSAAQASLGRAGSSHADPRVRAVVALAPAVARALTRESLAAVRVPVLVVVGDSRVRRRRRDGATGGLRLSRGAA